MLSLPQTITVDIATPTIDALPDGAVAGAPGGSAHGRGFAATMLATQPVATNTADRATGAGEALPVTGNTLPQQIAVPPEFAGANLAAVSPATDLAASGSATPAATNTATNAPAGTALDTSPAAAMFDEIAPPVTIAEVAPLIDAPLADEVNIRIPATSAAPPAPAGLLNPQSLLEAAAVTDAEPTVDTSELAGPLAATGATPRSDVLREPLISPVNVTDEQQPSLHETAERQAGMRPHDILTQLSPVRPNSLRNDPNAGSGVTNRLAQGVSQQLTLPPADSGSMRAYAGQRVTFRDDTAPILTARLNAIPGIVSSRQHGFTGGLTVSGDGLAASGSPLPDATPQTPARPGYSLPAALAPRGNGLSETPITLQGAPQVVDIDTDLKSLQRMLATPAPNTSASDAKAPLTAQPAATPLLANANAVIRPEGAAQTLTRAARPSAVTAKTAPGSAAASSLSDAIQVPQPSLKAAAGNPAVTTPPQADTVPRVAVVAPPRYAKPSTNIGVKVPKVTATVATAAGPDLMTVDSATVVARPDAGSAAAPSTVALTTPLPAATTSSTTSAQVLNMPVTDNAWGAAISERVAVLAGQKILSANIRLNPTELGPLRVDIKVDDGNAQVHFVAQNAVTRDAIEQAMPRLRELLAAEGLNLTGADVSEQGIARDQGEQSHHARSSDAVNEGKPTESQGGNDEPVERSRSDGLVDTFA